MWWHSCFQDNRSPSDSEKWYHHEPKSKQGGGRFYGGGSKQPTLSHNSFSTNTMSLNKQSQPNDNETLSVGDKKPCAFYNQRSLTKELEMTENHEHQLKLLRNQNKQLKEMVRQLTPLKEKYNKLRGQYLKKEREMQQLEARVASLQYNSK